MLHMKGISAILVNLYFITQNTTAKQQKLYGLNWDFLLPNIISLLKYTYTVENTKKYPYYCGYVLHI